MGIRGVRRGFDEQNRGSSDASSMTRGGKSNTEGKTKKVAGESPVGFHCGPKKSQTVSRTVFPRGKRGIKFFSRKRPKSRKSANQKGSYGADVAVEPFDCNGKREHASANGLIVLGKGKKGCLKTLQYPKA